MTEDFQALADEAFVSLTSFKRNGAGVAAALWIAADGDRLAVWTPADSWKVKRVRRDPRVTLVPCGRFGKVRADAIPVSGTAEVVDDPSAVAATEAALRKKYGFQFRVVTLIEAIVARGAKPRVVITIAPV